MGTTLLCIETPYILFPFDSILYHLGTLVYSTYKFTLKLKLHEKWNPLEPGSRFDEFTESVFFSLDCHGKKDVG